jgi:hypothetical protein
MYAVVYEVQAKPDWEGDADAELDVVVEMSKNAPGFVRGMWLTGDTRSLSIQVVESEEIAREHAENAFMPPDASVTLVSASVFEVVAEA